MKRLRISIIDIVSNKPTNRLYSRLMNANFASIMPQVIAAWCTQLGHDVRFVCYTGTEDLTREPLDETDVLIVGAFSLSAQLAYAISSLYRRHGAVTVLGGPHARCYPEDAAFYFDYVLGLSDKQVIEDLLADCAPHRPVGRQITAARQPTELPSLEERWPFVEATIAKAPLLKLIPMLGSTGCPYTCSFCIDSQIKYQAFGFDRMREDLRFLTARVKRPYVAWHDPNFGVRFDDYLGAIEESVGPGKVRFLAESSLSLLSEDRLKRLRHAGFVGMLPGVESWYSLGNKSRSAEATGMDKVRQISEQVNTILRYIPFVQTNFVLGLDCDEGAEPFELTKRFMDLTPGAYPAFSLLTAYGRAAPLNLEFQAADRVIPLPFHFLNSTRGMNVRPKNYAWDEFFGHVSDLVSDIHSTRRIARRFGVNQGVMARSISALRAATSRKAGYYRQLREELRPGTSSRRFFDGEHRRLPDFFVNRVRDDLGPFWELLPQGALMHDHKAYLASERPAETAPSNVARFRRPLAAAQ